MASIITNHKVVIMGKHHQLTATDMGIDTHQEPVVYMRNDCHICRVEGFMASSRVAVEFCDQTLIVTVNVVTQNVLPAHYIGFSSIAFERLGITSGEKVRVKHAPVISSVSAVREKFTGMNSVMKRLEPLSMILMLTVIVI